LDLTQEIGQFFHAFTAILSKAWVSANFPDRGTSARRAIMSGLLGKVALLTKGDGMNQPRQVSRVGVIFLERGDCMFCRRDSSSVR
jgi:hypothetical protein